MGFVSTEIAANVSKQNGGKAPKAVNFSFDNNSSNIFAKEDVRIVNTTFKKTRINP